MTDDYALCIKRWVWNTDDPEMPYWHIPGAVSVIDLRTIPQMSRKGGVPEGYALAAFESGHGGETMDLLVKNNSPNPQMFAGFLLVPGREVKIPMEWLKDSDFAKYQTGLIDVIPIPDSPAPREIAEPEFFGRELDL